MNRAILCVDDEAIILSSLEMQLRPHFEHEYAIEFANSADEALELIDELANDGVTLVVLISDWQMPGMKGDELLIAVHARFPRVVKIMLTGEAEARAIRRATEFADLHCCLRKPWDSKELVNAIRAGGA